MVLEDVKLDAAEHAPLVAPLVDIPIPLERQPSLSPDEFHRRQLTSMVEWAIAGAERSRSFSYLRICSGATHPRSILCVRSAIAERSASSNSGDDAD